MLARRAAPPPCWAVAGAVGGGRSLGARARRSPYFAGPVCGQPCKHPRVRAQVHAYVALPGGRTGYLSELRSGAEVLVADAAGRARAALVGRAKVERRPLVIIEVRAVGGGLGGLATPVRTAQRRLAVTRVWLKVPT